MGDPPSTRGGPHRNCISFALGLPCNLGGRHGPGGTAGVCTSKDSDTCQNKAKTKQKCPKPNNQIVFVKGK